jgi:hypothetical protein
LRGDQGGIGERQREQDDADPRISGETLSLLFADRRRSPTMQTAVIFKVRAIVGSG